MDFKLLKEKGGKNEMQLNIKLTKEKRNCKNQNGVTLIALVVTIVVLLILAGVSVNALFGNSGIIEKAKEAQNAMDKAKENDEKGINELTNWIDNQVNGTTGRNNNPTTSDLPSVAGETMPYYPDATFKKVAGTNLDDGLVIQDESGNEYVWIEVPKSLYANSSYNTETTTGDKKPSSSTDYDKIEYCLHKYTDYYRNGTKNTDTYYSDAATGLTSAQYTKLKQEVLKSIYENGGFWIGRYEAGVTTNRTESDGTPTVAPLSKAGTVEKPIYPYTYVTCSQAQTLTSKLSTGKSYNSSLMFGVQWDLVLKHIEVKEVAKGIALDTIQKALKSDSTGWGNYNDASFTINRGKYADWTNASLSTTWTPYNQTTSNNFVNVSSVKQVQSGSDGILLTTGASDECKKMNIYDLAGNVKEFTLESTNDSDAPCADRGGISYMGGSRFPAFNRTFSYTMLGGRSYVGFRVSLFK